MGDVEQTIIIIFVTRGTFSGEITVVNPNLGSNVEGNKIFALRGIVHLKVAKNHIADTLEKKPSIGQSYTVSADSFQEHRVNQESSPELAPTPVMVVLPMSLTIPHPVKIPEILMTPPLATAEVKAEQEVTVTAVPLPPPVVPAA